MSADSGTNGVVWANKTLPDEDYGSFLCGVSFLAQFMLVI